MNRKLKVLGLALAAVMAMAAFSASASANVFHGEQGHLNIQGSQIGTDIFTTNAGTVKCNEAVYTGTTASTATPTGIKVTPVYTECTAFGFVNATIDVNNCHYEFTPTKEPIHIECTGTPITVTAFNCWVTVDTQTVTSGVTYDNEGAGTTRDVRVTVNLSGIKYTQHSKSFPGCTNGTFTNGTYVGEATVKGFSTAGAQVGIWAT